MLSGLILTGVTAAGWMDYRSNRIPNWLVLCFALSGVIFHVLTGGWSGLGLSLGGLGLGLAVLFPLFAIRAMGAGDVKLLAALGAAVTYKHVLIILLVAAAIAGIMALMTVWRGSLLQVLFNVKAMVFATLSGDRETVREFSIDSEHSVGIPFGVSLALASWVFVIFNWSRI